MILEDRFGVLEIIKDDGGSTEPLWNGRLADFTDREEEIRQSRYLPQTDYGPSLKLLAGETLEVQAECASQSQEVPVTVHPQESGRQGSCLHTYYPGSTGERPLKKSVLQFLAIGSENW